MFKISLILFLTVLLFGIIHPCAKAVGDPFSVPNNKFGIHIADPVDLDDAAKLVNSTGGDWGYVTFVIRNDERDTKRWQKVFDKCRNLHLIPIVRLASHLENGNWIKLSLDEIDGWVSFFNSLTWVTQNRYIIIGNEPNHAEEWGGEVNPAEYTLYLRTISQKLKQTNDDYFILPAGLDASAPNSKTSMEESLYLQKMVETDVNIFDEVDGWTSHSYPNPAFTGSEYATGRGTIKTYQWELDYLKNLGVQKNLPVFITETGWAHNVVGKENLTSIDKIAGKLAYAFNNVWSDNKIVAVTPFILGYQEPPFDVFSWKDKSGNFYDFYSQVQALPKTKGEPIQIQQGKILAILAQPVLLTSSIFPGVAFVENTGQSVWDVNNIILKENASSDIVISETSLSEIQPNEVGLITFKAKTASRNKFSVFSVAIFSNKNTVISNIYKLPIVTIFPSLMNLNLIFDTI
ncbi:MAG: hypothetical protein ABSA43_00915 [Candidatus Microgenomates bacterium]